MISVIVPVYNSEKYLEYCVRSILNQTYTDIECILIDDSSSDNSGDICDKLAGQDSRINVIHHAKNEGLSISRYDGFKLSKGDFISFVDNDDYIYPWFYEQLVNNIGDAQMCCLGGGNLDTKDFDSQISQISKAVYAITSRKYVGSENMDIYLEPPKNYGLIRCMWGKIYTRNLIEDIIETVDKYKDKISWLFFEDIIFSPICFAKLNKAVFLNNIGYIHRIVDNSLSNRPTVNPYHYETADACEAVLSYASDNNNTKLYQGYLEPSLANLQSIWYKIDNFEVDRNTAEAGKKRIKEFYAKYYGNYIAINKMTIMRITIVLFYKAYRLWELSVGKLYFAPKYK